MNRSYVRSYVEEVLLKDKVVLTRNEINGIVDSVLFDWNEIGDREADFENLVEWNVDQYLTHNHSSNNDSGSLIRIRVDEASDYIPYPKGWIDQPTKPSSKYFYMRTLKSGWDEVRYFLDKKCNAKLYGKKLLEQLEV
jgi:hypothetical protein